MRCWYGCTLALIACSGRSANRLIPTALGTREVVGAVGSVVGQPAELLARALQLCPKRGVRPSAFVLEGVCIEDVDGGEDGDHADDEHAGEKLQEGATLDRPVGTAALPTRGRSLPGSRRRGRRRHRSPLSTR